MPRMNGNALLTERAILPIHQILLYLSQMTFTYLALFLNRNNSRALESVNSLVTTEQ